MKGHRAWFALALGLATVGCGRYVVPPSTLLDASIPNRRAADPQMLKSLRIAIVGVSVRPETDEEEIEERKEGAELKPGQTLPESDLVLEWRAGLLRALQSRQVQVVAQGGAGLEFSIRRSRSADYVFQVAVTPLSGRRWKKRYVLASGLRGPDVEEGSQWVIVSLFEDPEFLAALQGKALPSGTGIFLADAVAAPPTVPLAAGAEAAKSKQLAKTEPTYSWRRIRAARSAS